MPHGCKKPATASLPILDPKTASLAHDFDPLKLRQKLLVFQQNNDSYDRDTSFFEEYFNFPLDHTSTSEVHKNGENILQKGVKLEEMLILTYFN